MSKKDKSKDPKKDSSRSGERKKIEFNLSDGVSWHDFVGVFILIFAFIWRLIRLILAPAFWVYGENVRMFRFARASSHERTLTEDEMFFVETIPFIYTLTGLIGGILVGLFAALSFDKIIQDFIDSLNFDFLNTFFDLIGSIIKFIFIDVIFGLIKAIGTFFSWIINLILGAFQLSPFLALGGLLIIGVIGMLIYIGVTETGVFDSFIDLVKRAMYWLIGSPERFRLRVNSFYRRLNHWLTVKLVGRERLHTRTQIYFKKVVFYTIILSLYSFISGIFIGVSPEDWGGFDTVFAKVVFTSTVLFMAGVISGTLFFMFVARFLDLLNRKKYIAPKFIKGDEIDVEAIKQFTEEDDMRVKEELKVDQEALEKTKSPKAKSTKSKSTKSTSTEEEAKVSDK